MDFLEDYFVYYTIGKTKKQIHYNERMIGIIYVYYTDFIRTEHYMFYKEKYNILIGILYQFYMDFYMDKKINKIYG